MRIWAVIICVERLPNKNSGFVGLEKFSFMLDLKALMVFIDLYEGLSWFQSSMADGSVDLRKLSVLNL